MGIKYGVQRILTQSGLNEVDAEKHSFQCEAPQKTVNQWNELTLNDPPQHVQQHTVYSKCVFPSANLRYFFNYAWLVKENPQWTLQRSATGLLEFDFEGFTARDFNCDGEIDQIEQEEKTYTFDTHTKQWLDNSETPVVNSLLLRRFEHIQAEYNKRLAKANINAIRLERED